MEVRVKKLHPGAIIPTYAHPTDAGMDFYALADSTIPPQQRVVIPTGIALELPTGTVLLMWDKSGLAANAGITTLGGVIDADYRGEIKVTLYNTTPVPYAVKAGHKIAQGLLQLVSQASLVETNNLTDSARGTGGFGSTGQ